MNNVDPCISIEEFLIHIVTLKKKLQVMTSYNVNTTWYHYKSTKEISIFLTYMDKNSQKRMGWHA